MLSLNSLQVLTFTAFLLASTFFLRAHPCTEESFIDESESVNSNTHAYSFQHNLYFLKIYSPQKVEYGVL